MSKAGKFLKEQAAKGGQVTKRDYARIEIPLKHVEAVLDALVWASEEALHQFGYTANGEWNDWRYKRYEMALDLVDAEVRQANRERQQAT